MRLDANKQMYDLVFTGVLAFANKVTKIMVSDHELDRFVSQRFGFTILWHRTVCCGSA